MATMLFMAGLKTVPRLVLRCDKRTAPRYGRGEMLSQLTSYVGPADGGAEGLRKCLASGTKSL